jgi:pyruvate,orthophosphate dikinase
MKLAHLDASLEPSPFGATARSVLELASLGARVPRALALDAELVSALSGADGERHAREVELASRALARDDGLWLLAVRPSALGAAAEGTGTIVALGASRAALAAVEHAHGRRVALDLRRRLLASWGLALGLSRRVFTLERPPHELSVAELERAVADMEPALAERVPELDAAPATCLSAAIVAATRAAARALGRRGPEPCVLQSLVLSTLEPHTSGAGRASSRSLEGEPRMEGRWLPGGMGEELATLGARTVSLDPASALGQELAALLPRVERLFGDAVELSFAVERGASFALDHRRAPRSPRGAFRIAHALVGAGVVSEREAPLRVTPSDARMVLGATLDPTRPTELLTRGVGGAPGLATGPIALSVEAARASARGAILLATDPSTEDVPGIAAGVGVLTTQGGLTCHAAVVARALGKVAVVGARELGLGRGVARIGERELVEGTLITLDGTTGEVLLGAALARPRATGEDLAAVLALADRLRELPVWALVRDEVELEEAARFGAEAVVAEASLGSALARAGVPIAALLVKSEAELSLARALEPSEGATRPALAVPPELFELARDAVGERGGREVAPHEVWMIGAPTIHMDADVCVWLERGLGDLTALPSRPRPVLLAPTSPEGWRAARAASARAVLTEPRGLELARLLGAHALGAATPA